MRQGQKIEKLIFFLDYYILNIQKNTVTNI